MLVKEAPRTIAGGEGEGRGGREAPSEGKGKRRVKSGEKREVLHRLGRKDGSSLGNGLSG